MSKKTQSPQSNIGAVSCRYLFAELWFISMIWFAIMMGIMFYMDIKHEQKVDKIWEKYEQDMKLLHNGN